MTGRRNNIVKTTRNWACFRSPCLFSGVKSVLDRGPCAHCIPLVVLSRRGTTIMYRTTSSVGALASSPPRPAAWSSYYAVCFVFTVLFIVIDGYLHLLITSRPRVRQRSFLSEK